MSTDLMRLFLIAFVYQFISMPYARAAHPDYSAIKYLLMKVGENKITFDCALTTILGNDLKRTIMRAAYQDTYAGFFHGAEWLRLYDKNKMNGHVTTIDFTDNIIHNTPPDDLIPVISGYDLLLLKDRYPILYETLIKPLAKYGGCFAIDQSR